MSLVKKGRFWYWAYRNAEGRITSVSLKTEDRAEAERHARDVILAVQSQRRAKSLLRLFPETRPPEPLTVTAPLSAEHRRGGIALKSILPELEKITTVTGTNRRAITRFVKEYEHLKYADRITPELALDYLERHYSSGRNYKAFNNNRGILNKTFKLLLVRMGLKESPFDRIPCRTVKDVESHRPISDDEFRKIYARAEEPFRTAACLGFYAGADMSTAFQLPCKAVNLEKRLIRWKRPKTGVWFTCGIHAELLHELKKVKFDASSDRPLLDSIQKTCTTSRVVYYRTLFNELGIEDTPEGKASFHSFRSSFFTRCDAAKLERRTTSLAGGHLSDDMNDLYSHDVSAAHEVEKLPSLGIVKGE